MGNPLADAIKQIEKKFGPGTVFQFGSDKKILIEPRPTGIVGLDRTTGIGGFPKGMMVELWGPEGIGKSTLGYEFLAEGQRRGEVVAYIDTEHSVDPTYAEAIGMKWGPQLLFSQPFSLEQAYEILTILVRSGVVTRAVVDSVAGLNPQDELEGTDIAGQNAMALQARKNSQALRILSGDLSKNGTTVLFINQVREKVGIVYGNPETTPGGNALKFWAKMRIKVSRIKVEYKKGKGHGIRINIVKNNLSPPFTVWDGFLEYGKGIDRIYDLVIQCIADNIIEARGNWYFFTSSNQKIACGLPSVYTMAIEDDGFLKKLKEEYENRKAVKIDVDKKSPTS